MAAGGRPRRARQGCIRAACLLLAVAGLVFTVLAGIKASMQAGLVAQRGPLTEDVLGPLANIFVCITFAWQVDKLGFLQLVRAAPPPFRKVLIQPHMRQTKLLTPGSAAALRGCCMALRVRRHCLLPYRLHALLSLSLPRHETLSGSIVSACQEAAPHAMNCAPVSAAEAPLVQLVVEQLQLSDPCLDPPQPVDSCCSAPLFR